MKESFKIAESKEVTCGICMEVVSLNRSSRIQRLNRKINI